MIFLIIPNVTIFANCESFKIGINLLFKLMFGIIDNRVNECANHGVLPQANQLHCNLLQNTTLINKRLCLLCSLQAQAICYLINISFQQSNPPSYFIKFK